MRKLLHIPKEIAGWVPLEVAKFLVQKDCDYELAKGASCTFATLSDANLRSAINEAVHAVPAAGLVDALQRIFDLADGETPADRLGWAKVAWQLSLPVISMTGYPGAALNAAYYAARSLTDFAQAWAYARLESSDESLAAVLSGASAPDLT